MKCQYKKIYILESAQKFQIKDLKKHCEGNICLLECILNVFTHVGCIFYHYLRQQQLNELSGPASSVEDHSLHKNFVFVRPWLEPRLRQDFFAKEYKLI